MTAPQRLQIKGISKSFGRKQVLQNINLEFAPGEFIGLMGPNGAGKSTLIKIMDGVYSATSGSILLDGEPVASLATHPQVAFIHQDLGLVDDLSIADNLRLGETPMRALGPILNKAAERRAAREVLSKMGLNLSESTLVGKLSAGEKALVAIARAFARGASTIVVDEATSTLPPAESQRVIDALSASAARGATIIMVTHKLAEILTATTRVVVLIDGKLAADRPTKGLNRAHLVDLLFQAEEVEDGEPEQREPGEVVLQMSAASTKRIGPVDLTLRAGQIVGISGLPGSGVHDIGFMAYGMRKPVSGKVIGGRPHIRRAIVPPHRESQGGFNDLSVGENISISSVKRRTNFMGLIQGSKDKAVTEQMVNDFDIKPSDVDGRYGVMSGGNKQKAVFARAVLKDPDLYVLCEPTRGVDIGTRSQIYAAIRRLRDRGAAVLLISADAEDLFAVCDVVGIVAGGRVSTPKPVKEMTSKELEMIV